MKRKLYLGYLNEEVSKMCIISHDIIDIYGMLSNVEKNK